MNNGSIISGGGGSFIKAVQRSTVVIANAAATNTATITAVVTANTLLHFVGQMVSTGTVNKDGYARIDLTNTTTITATRIGTTGPLTVSFEAVEYNPGPITLVQRGTIATASVTSNTATITSVTTATAQVDYLGNSNNDTGGDPGNAATRLTLTNATTITASTFASAVTQTTSYQVTDWNP